MLSSPTLTSLLLVNENVILFYVNITVNNHILLCYCRERFFSVLRHIFCTLDPLTIKQLFLSLMTNLSTNYVNRFPHVIEIEIEMITRTLFIS